MAEKLTCPGCGSHTSAVWRAALGYNDMYRDAEDPTFECPYCGTDLSGVDIPFT